MYGSVFMAGYLKVYIARMGELHSLLIHADLCVVSCIIQYSLKPIKAKVNGREFSIYIMIYIMHHNGNVEQTSRLCQNPFNPKILNRVKQHI